MNTNNSSSSNRGCSYSPKKDSNGNVRKYFFGSGSSCGGTGRVEKRDDSRSKSVGDNGNNRSTSTFIMNDLDATVHSSGSSVSEASFFDASGDVSLYLDEAPKVPQRQRKGRRQGIKHKKPKNTSQSSTNKKKPKKKKKKKKGKDNKMVPSAFGDSFFLVDSKNSYDDRPAITAPATATQVATQVKEDDDQEDSGGTTLDQVRNKGRSNDQKKPSSESHLDSVDPELAMQMVKRLQRKYKESQREVSRLSKITKTQKIRVKLYEKEKMLRKQQLELKEQQKEISERNVTDVSDHLVEQITELMDENNTLLDKMGVEKVQAGIKLKQKDEELRFLQEELKCMRSEKGERDYGGSCSGSTTSGCSILTTKDNNSKLKIWKQKKAIDDKTHRKQMKALNDRVLSLQVSNDKLNHALGNKTLTIHEDDDDEIRRAKEVAQAVSDYGITRAKTASMAKDKMYNALLRRSASDESSLPSLGLSSFTSKNNDTTNRNGTRNVTWRERRLNFNLKITKRQRGENGGKGVAALATPIPDDNVFRRLSETTKPVLVVVN